MSAASPTEACPGCGCELPAHDLQAQRDHMQREHPEIIEERLLEGGFEPDGEGGWIDMLASD